MLLSYIFKYYLIEKEKIYGPGWDIWLTFLIRSGGRKVYVPPVLSPSLTVAHNFKMEGCIQKLGLRKGKMGFYGPCQHHVLSQFHIHVWVQLSLFKDQSTLKSSILLLTWGLSSGKHYYPDAGHQVEANAKDSSAFVCKEKQAIKAFSSTATQEIKLQKFTPSFVTCLDYYLFLCIFSVLNYFLLTHVMCWQ